MLRTPRLLPTQGQGPVQRTRTHSRCRCRPYPTTVWAGATRGFASRPRRPRSRASRRSRAGRATLGRCRPCLQARGLFLLPAGAGVGACLLLAVGAGRRRRGRRGGISRPAGRTQYREYRRAARGRALGMRMQHRSRRRGIRRSGLPAARMWTCTARMLGSGVPVVDSVLAVSAAHLFTDSTRSFLSLFPCVVVVFSSPSLCSCSTTIDALPRYTRSRNPILRFLFHTHHDIFLRIHTHLIHLSSVISIQHPCIY